MLSGDRGLVETNLLGVRVHASSFERAIGFVEQQVAARTATFVVSANVYSVMLATEQPELHGCFEQAGMVYADGMPIVWSLRTLGYPAERVHGDDLMLACCERFPGWGHYLLGGRPGQPETVAHALTQRFPTIKIAGVHATPERPPAPGENARILNEIVSSRADIVWVGMGTPLQDVWMQANVTAVGLPMLGVGSAFDLVSGRTRRAPDWIKRSGMQWAFRLGQEPRRLFRRYATYNPRFVARIIPELQRRRRN